MSERGRDLADVPGAHAVADGGVGDQGRVLRFQRRPEGGEAAFEASRSGPTSCTYRASARESHDTFGSALRPANRRLPVWNERRAYFVRDADDLESASKEGLP